MPEAEDIDEGQKTKDLIASQFHLAATPHTMLSLEAVRASNVALPLPPETCNLAARKRPWAPATGATARKVKK